jgi:hypothetical protein
VSFYVHDSMKRIAGWEADLGKRRIVPGALMGYGRDLPHDLTQYVIEAATGCEHGPWGLVSTGATFRSMGRDRTKPGRAVIARYRSELQSSEHLTNVHVAQWRSGARTPVTEALDRARDQWRSLPSGDRLVFEWPSARGELVQRARREPSVRPSRLGEA